MEQQRRGALSITDMRRDKMNKYCTNCGKLLVDGVLKCGYCEHPLPEADTKQIKIHKPLIRKVKISSGVKWAMGIYCLLVGWQTLYIGALICWFLWAPVCAEMADDHNRSTDYGFAYGIIFGIFGIMFYWAYLKLTKDPPTKKEDVA
jgi:hypothetical protein